MSSERPADAVLFVLLDAFRHDYLTRTRFLKQISACSAVGRLEEPFGFCPRGAYFGGLSMAEQGYTNTFRYDPDNSPFRWTRHLAGTGRDALVRARLRTEIMLKARAASTSFASSYLDPVDIPLEWLGYFDPCEKEAPSSRRVGYRSLFHILEDAGRPWVDWSWPYPGWTGNLSSERVAAFALEQLHSQHSFAFIHLPDLDLKGHPYGPGSPEIQATLDETDRLCEIIHARALELYRDPVILFAGDHGMLPIVRKIDVASALASTGLRFGHDFAYFIDSTMVRCWYFTEDARRITLAALSATVGGHLVTDDETRRWGLAGIDSRNGHDVFLADPGVLFSPSFFDWSGSAPPRGMHGYAPDVSDNQAIFLAHWPRRQRACQVGTVQARRLFPTMLQWLGWDPAAFTSVQPVAIEVAARPRGPRWSVNGTDSTDAVVDGHLSRIVRAVRDLTPEADGVIIAGGFGRGEGTVVREGTSGRPVNDYDVVVVGGNGAALAGLDKTLAQEFEIDFVDLWARPDLPVPEKVSQFDYDLRYGSRLLWGNPLLVDRLPRYAPADIGIDEGIFQIGNRSGGLLLALTGVRPAADSSEWFLMRQGTKFLTAIADCWLMAWEDYQSSYAIRRERFRDLAGSMFSRPVLDAIDAAFVSKLEGIPPRHLCPSRMAALAAAALHELECLLGWNDGAESFVSALAATAPKRIRSVTDWLEPARARGLMVRDDWKNDGPSCVAAIYRASVQGLRAWPDGQPARFKQAALALAPQFDAAGSDDDRLLAAVAETWLGFFH